MPQDRRAEPRYPARIAVTVQLAEGSVLAYSQNLSVSGAFLECDAAVAERDAVELRLPAHVGIDPIVVGAEVRWVARGPEGEVVGIGVRFAGMRARDMRAWTRYIRTLK